MSIAACRLNLQQHELLTVSEVPGACTVCGVLTGAVQLRAPRAVPPLFSLFLAFSLLRAPPIHASIAYRVEAVRAAFLRLQLRFPEHWAAMLSDDSAACKLDAAMVKSIDVFEFGLWHVANILGHCLLDHVSLCSQYCRRCAATAAVLAAFASLCYWHANRLSRHSRSAVHGCFGIVMFLAQQL